MAAANDGEAKLKLPRPPYDCPMIAISKFFDVAKTTRVEVVDKNFIVAHDLIDPSTTGKFANALRFLGIIDADGKPTDRIHLLNAEGEVFVGNLAKIVNDAYAHLLSTIKVDKAKPEYLYAYYTDQNRYGLTLPNAKAASKFFVWLATLSGINVSEELKGILPKGDRKPRGPTKVRTADDGNMVEPVQNDNGKSEEEVQPKELTVSKTLQAPRQPQLSSASNIQATITMSLDKDTPVEVWRMVLKLLGLQDSQPQPPQLS
ncbi:MAG TPA: DUF5343 domain-containing protein [Nitrososphaera sp.]|nr:DUF5343 domain-containing protein [Nitrososphaera sp.]